MVTAHFWEGYGGSEFTGWRESKCFSSHPRLLTSEQAAHWKPHSHQWVMDATFCFRNSTHPGRILSRTNWKAGICWQFVFQMLFGAFVTQSIVSADLAGWRLTVLLSTSWQRLFLVGVGEPVGRPHGCPSEQVALNSICIRKGSHQEGGYRVNRSHGGAERRVCSGSNVPIWVWSCVSLELQCSSSAFPRNMCHGPIMCKVHVPSRTCS